MISDTEATETTWSGVLRTRLKSIGNGLTESETETTGPRQRSTQHNTGLTQVEYGYSVSVGLASVTDRADAVDTAWSSRDPLLATDRSDTDGQFQRSQSRPQSPRVTVRIQGADPRELIVDLLDIPEGDPQVASNPGTANTDLWVEGIRGERVPISQETFSVTDGQISDEGCTVALTRQDDASGVHYHDKHTTT
ncbi:MAG: GvpH [Halorubrum sp. J07HR59]|nr:MAG: GvpH [Halorubrum sp. J07HR59]